MSPKNRVIIILIAVAVDIILFRARQPVFHVSYNYYVQNRIYSQIESLYSAKTDSMIFAYAQVDSLHTLYFTQSLYVADWKKRLLRADDR